MKRRRGQLHDEGTTAFVFRPGCALDGTPLPGTVSKVFKPHAEHDFFRRELRVMSAMMPIVRACAAECLFVQSGALDVAASFSACQRKKCGEVTDPAVGPVYQMVYKDCGPSLGDCWPPARRRVLRSSAHCAPPSVLRNLATALVPLFQGVADMHAAGMAHNDIKPANVLYDIRTNTVTLIDFGLATVGRNSWYTSGSTYSFHAPEFQIAHLLRQGCGPEEGSDDILAAYANLLRWLQLGTGMYRGVDFSLAAMRAELVWGEAPASSSPDVYSAGILLLYIVRRLDKDGGMTFEGALATELTRLARRMMCGNPARRPLPTQCLRDLRLVLA